MGEKRRPLSSKGKKKEIKDYHIKETKKEKESTLAFLFAQLTSLELISSYTCIDNYRYTHIHMYECLHNRVHHQM